VQGDLADRELLRKVFQQHPIRTVMHFAALALIGESMREPGLYYDNNLCRPLVLLAEAQAAGVERFVLSSTAAVYGQKNPSPIGETASKDPINPYGQTKLALERALHWYREIHGMSYFCLRYFNACGATRQRGERHHPETHLIPLVLGAAAAESSIRIAGTDYPTPDGTCVRDYIHVEDLADAHIAALDAAPELSGSYNVGTGRGHSVREVIETARRVTRRTIAESAGSRRPGDPPELVSDPSLIQEKLAWKAKRNLEMAIQSAWEFKQRFAKV
jgi:UDP-glucose 4-epimerase